MMKDIELYGINKNICIESPDDSLPVKVLKLFTHFLRSVYSHQDSKIVFSERIIEYPLLFQYLKPDARRILDFGCVEDLLPIHLASLGYHVTGIDFRKYPFTHKNFDYIQTDILQWDPPYEEFDTVVSISTIEHVGLAAYKDPVCKDGDKIAIEKLWKCLKKGGVLIITLPAGKPCIERGMRIYDRQAIECLVPNIEILRFFYKPDRYGEWQETTEEVIQKLIYDKYYVPAPVQGLSFIYSVKP